MHAHSMSARDILHALFSRCVRVRPHPCLAGPTSPSWTTHIVRPNPPDLTGLCLILFMDSHIFSFYNRMFLHMLSSSTFYLRLNPRSSILISITYLSWFIPRSSMSLRTLTPTSDSPTHFRHFWIDLRPHWVVGLLLILSHGLSYVSIILLYLILSILLDYISTSDLRP